MNAMKKIAGLGVTLGVCGMGYGWNGPLCYPDVTQQITLTIETWAGERPGDIEATIKDGDEITLVSVGASEAYDDTHKVILKHTQGDQGIASVTLSNKNTTNKFTYEFEFRDGTCNGAIIERSLL